MSDQERVAVRDSNGRFVKGNRGGPGNPFARQVAALQQTLLASVTTEEVRTVGRKLVELALAGDVPAIKVLLSYAVGKPSEAVDPDQLDTHEWDILTRTAEMTDAVPKVVRSLEPAMALDMGRRLRPIVAEALRLKLIEAVMAERDLDPALYECPSDESLPDSNTEPPSLNKCHVGVERRSKLRTLTVGANEALFGERMDGTIGHRERSLLC